MLARIVPPLCFEQLLQNEPYNELQQLSKRNGSGKKNVNPDIERSKAQNNKHRSDSVYRAQTTVQKSAIFKPTSFKSGMYNFNAPPRARINKKI